MKWIIGIIAALLFSGAGVPTAEAVTEQAVFSGGCFWCMESPFDKLDGVLAVTPGYSGGHVVNPTYEQVSGGTTGHAESVRIIYDPARISYTRLLDVYWHNIDPTVKDRQFCDNGNQYRSEIFYYSEEQRRLALQSRTGLEQTKPFSAPVVTGITAGGPFYPAEEKHQHYYKKNPLHYAFYRTSCGRDRRLKELWGAKAGH